MTDFWNVHSQYATTERMMLDSNAQELTKHELPEILSILPSIANADILELGAGIGRYTSHFIGKARHVTAVDFIEKFIEKNREDNGQCGNAEFIQADVTHLKFAESSFDLIFSNWLLMYLSDEEMESLAKRMLGWLRPGGHLFFRESCFYQAVFDGSASGTFLHWSWDIKQGNDPTHYRVPTQYNDLMTSVMTEESVGAERRTYGFDTVLSKKVQTYVRMKKNENQVCWLMQKAPRDAVQQEQGGFWTFQQFLDNQQYTRRGILCYEKMFGSGYVSTGGPSTTKEFVDLLKLTPGQNVLDVGCGIGGGDFYMAKNFGVEVLGMDLSANMVEIAMERTVQEGLPSVQFEVSDATKRVFPEASFDVVYSRDTILHISDKLALFKRFHSWLKPGGKVLISDYCCGEKPWTPQFQSYVSQRGYILCTPKRYGQFLEEAGFTRVQVEDKTDQFIQVVKSELKRAEAMKTEFVEDFSQDDHDAIINGWNEKLQRCESGDQRWVLFYAIRNLEGDREREGVPNETSCQCNE